MTTKKRRSEKHNLPGLEERYRYRMALRKTAQGRAMEAAGGDKQAIADMCKIGAVMVRTLSGSDGAVENDHAFWLEGILADIGQGIEPNIAFGWRVPRGNRKLHNGERFSSVKKAYEVATTIEMLVESMKGKPPLEAVSIASDLLGIANAASLNLIAYPPGSGPLGQGASLELALDIVVAVGASGHKGLARDTAREYYDELTQSRRDK